MRTHMVTDRRPHRQQCALAFVVARPALVRLPEIANNDGPVHRGDDLAEGQPFGGTSQHVAASYAALGAHETRSLERQKDLLEVGLRQAGPLRYVANRRRCVRIGMKGE